MAFPLAYMQKFSKNYFSALNEQIWMKIHNKECKIFKKIDLSEFILLPSAKKLKLESKCQNALTLIYFVLLFSQRYSIAILRVHAGPCNLLIYSFTDIFRRKNFKAIFLYV